MDEERTCEFRDEGQDIFVIVDGVKNAKRTALASAYAGICIVLEPGWVVRDAERGQGVEVMYEGARIH
jgi:hypothetical protein